MFLWLHKQMQASLLLQMSQKPRSATWGGRSSCWRVAWKKRPSALHFKVSQLIETVSSIDDDCSYLGFEDVIELTVLIWSTKRKEKCPLVVWGAFAKWNYSKRESMEAGYWFNPIRDNRHSPRSPFNTGRPLSIRFSVWMTSIMTCWLKRAMGLSWQT